MNVMPRTQKSERRELTREERRERRLRRRAKQREDNIGRAAKMHAARLRMERANHEKCAAPLKASAFVGCSGWFYWKWRGLFYPDDLPTGEWFRHYAKHLRTVEINASFYSWPTVANVKAWRRQAREGSAKLGHAASRRFYTQERGTQCDNFAVVSGGPARQGDPLMWE